MCVWQRVRRGVGCGGRVGGGLLRRGLVGGSFSAISAGDTMKVTRQKDLIAPFLSLAIWGDFSLPLLQCVWASRNSLTLPFSSFPPTFLSPPLPFLFIPPPPPRGCWFCRLKNRALLDRGQGCREGEGEVDRYVHRVKEGQRRVVGSSASGGRSLFAVCKGDWWRR